MSGRNGRTSDPLALAQSLFETFRGRRDVYAEQVNGRPHPVHQALKIDDIVDHIEGRRKLGFYLICYDTTCSVSCVDIDDHGRNANALLQAEKLHRYCCGQGLTTVLEVSSSGQGGHVWWLHPDPIEAWQVRAAWRQILERAGLPSSTEIFPKQGTTKGTEGGLGNFVWFPLHGGSESQFLHVNGNGLAPVEDVAALLNSPPFVDLPDLERVVGDLEKPTSAPVADVPQRWETYVEKNPTAKAATVWTTGDNGRNNRSDSCQTIMVAAAGMQFSRPECFNIVRTLGERIQYDKTAEDRWLTLSYDRATEFLSNCAGEEPSEAPRVIGHCLADVEPEEVKWLWPGRIPLGKLTLIVGDPGLGKSFMSLDIAARLSRGTPWPDRRSEPATVGNTVILSAEDDIADTIRPRLDAAEADVSRIFAISAVQRKPGEAREYFNLDKDLGALERCIQTNGASLVIVDPISAYLGGRDSHSNADIRGLLAPLAEIAARERCAIVAVTHMNKSGVGRAMYRAMGSLAFTAAARIAWLVVEDEDDKAKRLLLPIKSNLIAEPSGIAFKIDDGRVLWLDGEITADADAILEGGSGDRTERAEAVDFLRAELAGGPVEAKVLLRDARSAGHSDKTLRRAAKQIGVTAKKIGYGNGSRWVWAFTEDGHSPSITGQECKDGHTNGRASSENGVHLRAADGGDTSSSFGANVE